MTGKTIFFEGWLWWKLNNLELAQGMVLTFYKNATKGVKVKVRKCWGLIPKFVEVTREKLVGEAFLLPLS